MAREGVHENYLHEQPEEEEEAVVDVANDGHHLFIDAGRVLMLWGWGALAAVSIATGRSRPPDDSSAVHAFLAFVLWLLGVSLVAVVPVARQFPRAARAGAAVANAVIDCFFPPLN